MVMNESSSSYADLEAGFSSDLNNNRRCSYRLMAVATGFFIEDANDEEPHHFLDACALCTMPLRPNRDIYMYRGDTPFCSEECRQEQIEMDEALEKSRRLSASLRSQKKSSSATSPPKSQSIPIKAGTVAVS